MTQSDEPLFLSLSDEAPDLDFLEEFLASEAAPEGAMQLSDLDGFLTAVAIGPDLIMPSEWMPWVWGDGGPVWANMEDAQKVLGAIMGRYNEILRLLREAPEDYGPLFLEDAEGTVIAGDWAMGFLEGMRLRPDAWDKLLHSEEDFVLVAPILALCSNEEGEPLLEDVGEEKMETILAEMTEAIPPSVICIERYWRKRRARPEARAKVGRNEPCPCGSGRKYKKCCGAN